MREQVGTRGWSSGVRAVRAGVRAAGQFGGCAGGAAGSRPGARPVRPAGALVMVRPLEAPQPVRDAAAGPGGACRGVGRRGVRRRCE